MGKGTFIASILLFCSITGNLCCFPSRDYEFILGTCSSEGLLPKTYFIIIILYIYIYIFNVD